MRRGSARAVPLSAPVLLQKPEAGLIPKDAKGRLLEAGAISFVGTELHAALRHFFTLPKDAPTEVRSYLEKQTRAVLQKMQDAVLGSKQFLVGQHFTIADACALNARSFHSSCRGADN